MGTLDEHAKAGMAAMADRKWEAAIEEFKAAIALDDSRPDLNHAIGTAYLQRGEVMSAIPHLERTIVLAEPYNEPQHQAMKLQFHMGLAAGYAMADQTDKSIRTLQKVVDLWPARIEPRVQLAQLLLQSCRLDDGLAVYAGLVDHPAFDKEGKAAAEAVIGSIRAWRESEHPASIFLQAHAEEYRKYFDDIVAEVGSQGWIAEAARMARGPDGEPKPIVPQGARPYAMQRVDLVNPAEGTISGVYSEQEPMVVTLNGFEPLSQLPVMLPWKDQSFPVWICTRAPWHWLGVIVQFEKSGEPEERIARVDDAIGSWYLAGYNGDFGEKESGRFHFITDPEAIGENGVGYTVDLGRARFEAINSLLSRLAVVHEKHPIRRLIFGDGRLPD